MRLTVINTNILVRPIDEEESEIIVEKGVGELIRAEVKEIGDGQIHNNMQVSMKVRPSSIVWFDPADARVFSVDNEKWYIIRQDNLLVIEEDK